jgi:hypothetical protein
MSQLLQHTAVKITDSAQECSGDEKRLASNAKVISALSAQRGSEIGGTVRRLCRAWQTGRWLPDRTRSREMSRVRHINASTRACRRTFPSVKGYGISFLKLHGLHTPQKEWK